MNGLLLQVKQNLFLNEQNLTTMKIKGYTLIEPPFKGGMALVYKGVNDNGFESNPLSYCIMNMNVPSNRGHDSSSAFECAVALMQLFFKNIFDTVWAKKEEEDEITSIINAAKVTNNGKYVVSDHYLAGMVSACAREQIPFYIYPNVRDNGYCFRTITPVGGEMNDHIVDIPQEVRNWDGVTFLHPSGFLGSAVTETRAIEIVETILSNNK